MASSLVLAFVVALAVHTQRQLWRAQSWQPEVASSVRTSQAALQVRRVILVLCTLSAIGWLIASVHVHDDENWTDDEIQQVARDAAFDVDGGNDLLSWRSSVTDSLYRAEKQQNGPGSLKIEVADASGDGSTGGGDIADDESVAGALYTISDHGKHPACLTVTVTPGADEDFAVPDGSDPGSSSTDGLDTYHLNARATRGAC
ncbi:hypothetical protein [Streptomyces montanisoli]|uniref:Uncharacterized protein n=1 Tax=Streptomyces montanisoli TaxID=2798581 RepID=A0A940M9C9_9ACTN|nr:hypothetical protein [Streptomyces montanisoli]MBP0457174.1 hypothetical protein [Streptomyces montanisoli]